MNMASTQWMEDATTAEIDAWYEWLEAMANDEELMDELNYDLPVFEDESPK